MCVAIASLFALLFAVGMVICYLLGFFGGIYTIIPIGFAIGIMLLQWAISPAILSRIYKIDWVGIEGYSDGASKFIQETCEKNKIKIPRLGIIRDKNPNAFCFGRTKNSANLVITQGILDYCNEDEQIAVIGHELGHIVHNDFIVTTLVGMIPVIFYIIAVSIFRSSRYRRGGKNSGAGAILVIAIISYVVYLVSQLIALTISRYREYWADEFSAHSTSNPNALSSALVKIAYGLTREGKGKESDKKHQRYENTLMIFNAKGARALAAFSNKPGEVSTEDIKSAMAWDLWNPWAKLLEIQMTHPLPAKRIKALGDIAGSIGQMPYIHFDLKKPECYWDDFLCNILASWSWLLSIPAFVLVGRYTSNYSLAVGIALLVAGIALFSYLKFYHYPKNFTETRIVDVLKDPKASPTKGRPVILKGRIVGRGVPGLFYSEDLKMDDGTGLLMLDYNQINSTINFFTALFKTGQWIGKEVTAKGWYRRRIIPYMEIYRMDIEGKTKKIFTPGLKVALSVIPIFIGLLITCGAFA
jgi:Zn-dependent protease with chaperone function